MNVWAGTVPCVPVKASAGTVPAVPVNVCAGTVNELPGLEPPIVLKAPLEVPAFEPDTVATVAVPFVPAGVKLTVPFVPAGVKFTVPFVPTGVPALTAELVFWFPVKVGWLTVPAGVMVAFPPDVPTFEFAAIVPRSILPLSAETSEKPVGQDPETSRITIPEPNPVP